MSDSSESELSSHGSPEPSELVTHQHPLQPYLAWFTDQENLKNPKTSYDDYIRILTEESGGQVRHQTRVLFHMDRVEKKCNCYFFNKSDICFHIVKPVEQEQYDMARKQVTMGVSFRSLLFFDISHEEVLFHTLDQVNIVGQNEDQEVYARAVQCPVCKLVSKDLLSQAHHNCQKKVIISFGEPTTWCYRLPYGHDLYLDTNCVLLSYSELHHLIPIVSNIYKILERLELRTSIVQIIAQDPYYQTVLDALESQGKLDELGTYHIYIYLVHRLMPYLQTLTWNAVWGKMIPVFTVIRSDNVDILKDLTGFDEAEEEKFRLDSCPKKYRIAVKEHLQEIERLKIMDNEKLFRDMICDALSSSKYEEWTYVLRCLDVRVTTYKALRHAVVYRRIKGLDTNTWKSKRDFIYGKINHHTPGQILTNIFGVIPRSRIKSSLLQCVVLFSPGEYYQVDWRWTGRQL